MVFGEKMIFERPPLAKEVLCKENHEKFDKLGDSEKQLVKNLISTGNINLAAAKSKYNELVELPKESVQQTLQRYNMGIDNLMNYLHSCLEATETRYTQHGDRYEYINLSLRKETLKLLFTLHGLGKPQKKSKEIDLFENIEV